MSAAKLALSDERKARIVEEVQSFMQSEFDEPLSAFRAEALVDFMLRQIGPSLYNQAIQDARGYMAAKIEDLDTEFHLEDPL